jgi:hypothetical protein
MRSAGRQFQESHRVALTQRLKAERRRRKPRFGRKALWCVQRMNVSVETRDWLLGLLLGPDTRSLTARLMGDPHPMRSALWAKEHGWA